LLNSQTTRDLFDGDLVARTEALAEGAVTLRQFAAPKAQRLFDAVVAIGLAAPFRHMVTGGGFSMSVAMTNCGRVGWMSDRRGYRYAPKDPDSKLPWPTMPEVFAELAGAAALAAGYHDFVPDSCLINRYVAGARMSLHQDKNEQDFSAPIVSVSLGLSTVFLFGGLRRSDRPRRTVLDSGDVVVWGGPSRLTFHGVAPLADDEHPLTGNCRINLTFRKAL